jgi:hypothetical protein
LLHLVGPLCYLYRLCTVKHTSNLIFFAWSFKRISYPLCYAVQNNCLAHYRAFYHVHKYVAQIGWFCCGSIMIPISPWSTYQVFEIVISKSVCDVLMFRIIWDGVWEGSLSSWLQVRYCSNWPSLMFVAT